VDADSYVLQLVRYIHCNPLKAGLVKGLDQYVWSSHRDYLSKAKKWNCLYKDFVLQMLTDQISSQIRIYKQLMAKQQDEDLIRVNTKLQKGRKFKERLAHIVSIILKGQT
jgi:hypothetical protein